MNQPCFSNTQAEISMLKQDNITKPKNMIWKMQHRERALAQNTQGFRLDFRMDRREEWRDEKKYTLDPTVHTLTETTLPYAFFSQYLTILFYKLKITGRALSGHYEK